MIAETLCLRTFAETVRSHINRNSIIKRFGDERKFVQTGFQETKDASGVFVFYSLILDSLSYAAKVDGVDGIPDVSKQITTYIKSGQTEVPAKFIDIAQGKTAVADVSTCFSINLIPNISKSSLNIVLDAILGLVLADATLGKTTHKNFKDWRTKKAPVYFLAEAFVLSVRDGKNKVNFSSEISDEIEPLLNNIDDIQAILNALPRLTPITPPDNPES